MKRFIIEQSETEITSNSGLALVGAAINNQTNLCQEIDAIALRRGISHSDIIKSGPDHNAGRLKITHSLPFSSVLMPKCVVGLENPSPEEAIRIGQHGVARRSVQPLLYRLVS